MELKKIKRYINKSMQIGPQATFQVACDRVYSKFFDKLWRTKALCKRAHHSWNSIQKKHPSKNYEKFEQFWHDCINRLDLDTQSLLLDLDNQVVIKQAQEYADNVFSILGSPKKKYETIPWHEDIRLKAMRPDAEYLFNPSLYYKDTVIVSGENSIEKDIKIPWELSRLQHFFVLGYSYELTNNPCYVSAFESQYNNWLQHNSFLLGVNWSCPMDVGIRAISLIWAVSFFKKSKELSLDFFQKITENLYDHLYYLENNWEIYDSRTSNHYLSDLIGYLYLCYYFFDLPHIKKRAAWCFNELLSECKKQVFDEGTDYEGSTSYHRLVTEIFYHCYFLAPKMGFVLPQEFKEKLSKMLGFIAWCSPTKNSLIRIGDHDSGKILHEGLSQNIVATLKHVDNLDVKHYKQFGLSLIKTEAVYYSLRHHVYKKNQPSGHFHNDAASITLALNGIEIFIDPGSYVYTASAYWRNYFRSVHNHSTMYLKGKELIPFEEHLFALQLPEQQFLDEWIDTNNNYCLKTCHTLYKQAYGLTAYRSIQYMPEAKKIVLSDYWKTMHKKEPDVLSYWNFTLNPLLRVHKRSDHYLFLYNQKEIALFRSALIFDVVDGFSSPEYGVKVATKQLKSMVNIVPDDPVITEIIIL